MAVDGPKSPNLSTRKTRSRLNPMGIFSRDQVENIEFDEDKLEYEVFSHPKKDPMRRFVCRITPILDKDNQITGYNFNDYSSKRQERANGHLSVRFRSRDENGKEEEYMRVTTGTDGKPVYAILYDRDTKPVTQYKANFDKDGNIAEIEPLSLLKRTVDKIPDPTKILNIVPGVKHLRDNLGDAAAGVARATGRGAAKALNEVTGLNITNDDLTSNHKTGKSVLKEGKAQELMAKFHSKYDIPRARFEGTEINMGVSKGYGIEAPVLDSSKIPKKDKDAIEKIREQSKSVSKPKDFNDPELRSNTTPTQPKKPEIGRS